jgi:peptide/nickel transport system ATP-binding protein
MSCLKIKDLEVRFETVVGTVTAVDRVSLEHESGESLALVGETGCGKSVLAHAVLGLLPYEAVVKGEVWFEGKDLLTLDEKELSVLRGKEIAIVMQNPGLSLNPVYTIGHQVSEVYLQHTAIEKAEAFHKSRELLEKMGFKNAEQHLSMYPFEFSEGMKQRVLIAAALALGPKVIIADEPTKGLDDRLKRDVLEELMFVRKTQNISLIMITHDLSAAERVADSMAIMYCGEIVERGAAKDFFKAPMHPYSVALMQSLPEKGFNPIPGSSPSMISPPEGCRFHPRCRKKMPGCSQERPELKSIQGRDIRCFLYR